MPRTLLLATCALLGAVLSPVQAQSVAKSADFEFRPMTGKPLRGAWKSVDAKELGCGGAKLALADVWFLHGPAAALLEAGQVAIRLQSGESLVGDVLGGDEDGEALTLRSKSFGTLEISLDEVALLRVRGAKGFPDPVRFVDSSEDDTVFRETPLGFDPVRGVLESVDAKGLRFETDGKSQLFAWDRIAGLKLPAAESKKQAGTRLVLLMSDGSRVVGKPRAIQGANLVLAHASLGELRLALDRVLGGHVLDADTRVFVSTLEPKKVEESDLFSDRPLYSWRRDTNVLGAPMRVRRKHWTTGLGGHARSVLDFEVPAKVKQLLTWVGADDAAVMNRKVGDMRFRILRGEEVLAEIASVKGGQRAQPMAPIAVEPGQVLRFEIDFGNGLHTLDRGNWLAPVFVR